MDNGVPQDPQNEAPAPVQEAGFVYAGAPTQPIYGSAAEPQNEPQPAQVTAEPAQISWSASEYVGHQKGASWFGILILASVLVAGILYFLTRDILTTAAVLVVGGLFASFANRKPRVLNYGIGDRAIHIGQKTYFFGMFKSFALVENEGLHYIVLTPIKRLMVPINVYYDPSQEDQIADTLGAHLPIEDHQPDIIDSLMRRIRF